MSHISPEKIQELHTLISEASSIAIVTHTKPDGDAIGSSTGMYHIVKSYGKTAKIIIPNPAPQNLDFLTTGAVGADILTYTENPEEAAQHIMQSDLVICLDFNSFHRTDGLEQHLYSSQAKKVLIDHHLAPDLEQFTLVFSIQDISSASELLFHILMMLPSVGNDARRLPTESATALMTGMTTDTNNFMNSVYPSTLRMASSLLEAGVDRDMIIQNIYNRFKESRLRLQGLILKDLMKITPDGVAYIILDKEILKEYNVEEGDTEGFVNLPLSIGRVVMSILIKEDEGKARVSIRSRKGVSANMCAKLHFNGGGHENAAGGRLSFPEDIADLTHAEEYIKKYTHVFITEENGTI